MLKLFKPFIAPEAIKGVQRVFKSGQIAEGIEVQLFEKELEKILNKKNIVTVNSGTSALELAYDLAGISNGDEVIVPVLTCTATNVPLIRRGAKIVFADIDKDLNIDIQDVKNKITNKTKAIVFVHFGGNNRGLKELVRICKDRHIVLIEDAAQAVGSDYWGKSDFCCVSLQAIKTLTSGDGGVLITRNKQDYIKARKLRWFGYDREAKQKKGDIDLELAGYKYHMNDISASIGRANLKYFSKLKKHQEKLAKIYQNYGLFAYAWLAGGFTSDYKGLKEIYNKNGVEMAQYHFRNDKYSVFGGRKHLPNMDFIEDKYFFIPFHYGVTLKQAHLIGKIYEDFNLR